MMFGKVSRAALACGLVAVAAHLARAEDWPEFRGPTAQGRSSETGLPVEWSPGLNVAWKAPVPGLGWSSPVIVAGKVYLTSAVPAPNGAEGDLDLVAFCFDAQNGEIVWQRELFREEGATAPKIHGKNSHASPTPIARDGKLYVHFGHMGTACLDLQGEVVWKKTIAYQPVHGNGGSPVLVGDKLIFSVDSATDRYVVALNAKSGEQVWRFDRQGDPQKHFAFSTPLAIEVNGKTQVVSAGADYCSGLDVETGREIWFVKYKGYSIVPRPLFAHGLLFFQHELRRGESDCDAPRRGRRSDGEHRLDDATRRAAQSIDGGRRRRVVHGLRRGRRELRRRPNRRSPLAKNGSGTITLARCWPPRGEFIFRASKVRRS